MNAVPGLATGQAVFTVSYRLRRSEMRKNKTQRAERAIIAQYFSFQGVLIVLVTCLSLFLAVFYTIYFRLGRKMEAKESIIGQCDGRR